MFKRNVGLKQTTPGVFPVPPVTVPPPPLVGLAASGDRSLQDMAGRNAHTKKLM